MRRLKFKDIAATERSAVHGTHKKIGWVIHETVSPNYPGWNDIISVSEFLENEDYGIHGIVDNDANIAWSYGLGKAIFYHTNSSGRKGSGQANTNFMGIEQISRVMLDYTSMTARIKAWLHMSKELNAIAKLIAATARAQGLDISYIVDNPGNTHKKGVTTHWEVTNFFDVPGGHVDGWPIKRGGYYPKGMVITLARRYYRAGWVLGTII